jgi:flagellar basal body rod protein FlgG
MKGFLPGNFCFRRRNLFPAKAKKHSKNAGKSLWHIRCFTNFRMDVSLYQAAAAMNATERWQDLIAANLATSSVPGARKQEISFSDVAAGYATDSSGAVKSTYSIPAANLVVNFQPGEMRPTGNPMDFALDGKGFFNVQLPDGQTAYTRDGQFQINAHGQLVTNQGFLVLGANGPLQLNPNNGSAITVSADGNVSQGGGTKGKLQITEFSNPQQLTMIGGGLFRADNPGLQPKTATATQVRQGFIEESNASPTTQMAGLITAMRMFEANEKVMQMQSDRMSRAITDLSGTS